MTSWCLEGATSKEEGAEVSQIVLDQLPLVVGRDEEADLTLASHNVSRKHAEVVSSGKALFLRDLGSTNGTYINAEKVEGESRILEGDVVFFADMEFRLAKIELPSREVLDPTVYDESVESENSQKPSFSLDKLYSHQQKAPSYLSCY